MKPGPLVIDCPICHLGVAIPVHIRRCDDACAHDNDPGVLTVGHLVVDQDVVYAHLATHGPNDGGEPLPVAA
jgi:hypothetical protein